MKLEIENVDTGQPRPEFHRRIVRWESRETHLRGAWALFLECGHIATLVEIRTDTMDQIRRFGHVLCIQCRDAERT
jgi:hypothetical protein